VESRHLSKKESPLGAVNVCIVAAESVMASMPLRSQEYTSGAFVPRVAVALMNVPSALQVTDVRSAELGFMRASLLVSAVVVKSPARKLTPPTALVATVLMPFKIFVGGVALIMLRTCVIASGRVFLMPTEVAVW
jgi:hypothetical protein